MGWAVQRIPGGFKPVEGVKLTLSVGCCPKILLYNFAIFIYHNRKLISWISLVLADGIWVHPNGSPLFWIEQIAIGHNQSIQSKFNNSFHSFYLNKFSIEQVSPTNQPAKVDLLEQLVTSEVKTRRDPNPAFSFCVGFPLCKAILRSGRFISICSLAMAGPVWLSSQRGKAGAGML